MTKRKRPRRNPDAGLLRQAERLSKAFHGNIAGVYALSARERRPLPKYVVKVGNLDELVYRPDRDSQRGQYRWRHESGDRGFGRGRAKEKPMVAVDPRTRRAYVLPNRSPMRLTKRGLAG